MFGRTFRGKATDEGCAKRQEGAALERERITELENTPASELAAELRAELDLAVDAIPEVEWDASPSFIVDLVYKRLAEQGVAAAVALLEEPHPAHLLHFFESIRLILRRFDLAWHRTNLAVLEHTS